MHPLPLTDVATGACNSSATAARASSRVDASQPGIDSYPLATVQQMRQDPAVRDLIKRNRAGGWHRQVVVPYFDQERIGDQHGHRARLAHPRGLKRLEEHPRDLGLVPNLEEPLDDRAHDRSVGKTVHLADRRTRRAIDIGDDPDDRNAIKERLADPGQCVGQPRTRHDRENADLARGTCRRVGHHAGRSLMRDQQIGNRAGLERVPQLVVLGPRNPEDAAHALARQCRRRRLGAGHLALHSGPSRIPAQLDPRLGRSADDRHGRHRGPDRAASNEQLTPVQLG